MITLLAKCFIKNSGDLKDPAVRRRYGSLCSVVGIGLNLCLFAGKYLTGFLCGSIAIMADAFNNLSDAGSSLITLIGFKFAGMKPDKEHPFGHGRIEYISGLAVAAVIILMGFELAKSSVGKILTPSAVDASPAAIGVLAASVAVKLYMCSYNRAIGRRIDSTAMRATAADSLSDAAATLMVLFGMLIMRYTGIYVDGWCGVLVGLFICYAGYGAARDTVSPLLGQAPEKEFVRQINDIVMSYSDILGIHDLIVHNYGPGRVLISLHAEVPADGELLALHDTIDTIEHDLRDTLHCHAVIHMDPVCVGDEQTMRLKALVAGYIKEIGDAVSMHDFRIVTGPTHTNLIFDVAVPYDFHLSDRELTETLTARIQRDNPNYYAVIDVDKQMA